MIAQEANPIPANTINGLNIEIITMPSNTAAKVSDTAITSWLVNCNLVGHVFIITSLKMAA